MQRSDFAGKLVARWPDAIIEEMEKELEFQLKMLHGILYGSLGRLERTQSPSLVIGNGDFEDCADFVLWYRSIVPRTQALLFCDEGYDSKIMLEPGTTQADIFRAFKYTPP